MYEGIHALFSWDDGTTEDRWYQVFVRRGSGLKNAVHYLLDSERDRIGASAYDWATV